MGKSKQYRFWTNSDETDLSEFLDVQLNFTHFIKEILNDYRLGNLTREDEKDLKRKKLQVDIKFKEIICQIKQKELDYWQIFKTIIPM